MTEHWRKAKAIGLAAYGARAFGPAAGENAAQFGRNARERLPQLLQEWEWEKPKRMRALPPGTLHMLTALHNDHVTRPFKDRLQQAAQDALIYLMPKSKSPLAKATALAHHIMHGTGSAVRITRLGRSFFKRNGEWLKVEENWREQLDDVLTRLRGGGGTTEQRCGDIDDLMTLIDTTPAAAQISDSLYSHLYCWPLFVFPALGQDIAVGLPLAVDVDLSSKPDSGRVPVLVKGHSLLDLRSYGPDRKDWFYHLHRARWAGRLLWLRAHGNAGATFRQQVKEHQTVYDFGCASRIIEMAFGPEERLPLVGGSAAAYLSQVVLARLLGRRWYLSSAVTGRIGNLVWNEKMEGYERDFEFSCVGGTAAKVRHIFETRTFERVVLPNDPMTVAEITEFRERRSNSIRAESSCAPSDGAEVLFAAKLSKVADIVQVGGWRKTAFIRCPEIEWALHADNATGPLPMENAQVRKVLNQIVEYRGRVLSLDGVEPVAVASALHHINRLIHEKNQPNSPPGLSWCMVRAVKEEQDAAFWRTLWRLIGAPLSDYELLRDSPTMAVAARRLAHALNHSMVTEQAPAHRAPDIIIVVGAERFDESMRCSRTPTARPLAFPTLLNAMEKNDLLNLSEYRHKPECAEYAGQVRIIVVQDTDIDPIAQEDVAELESMEEQALEALSTFRFSFSQQMASLLLGECGISGYDVRALLMQLVKKKALRMHGGQFHMTQALWKSIDARNTNDISMQANRQYAAGLALAPYIVTAPMPALAYDMAFLPENVIEASVHLVKANDLYKQVNDLNAKNLVRKGLSRLCRFASLPHWGAVDRLNRAKHGRDAYELARELMEGLQNHPDNREQLPPHPSRYVQAIQALMNRDLPGQYLNEIQSLLEEGLAACERYPTESAFNRLQLLCGVSVYLYRNRPEMLQKIQVLDQHIWALRAEWENLQGAWFEKNGDAEQDHRAAAEHYLLGTKHASEYCQNWIKYLGAAHVAGLNVNGVYSYLAAISEKNARTFLWHMSLAYKRDSKRSDTSINWIQTRWKEGRWVLKQIWPHLFQQLIK